MHPLFWFCHTLPVLHKLTEKVLTRLGSEQIVLSWSHLVLPSVNARSLMWFSCGYHKASFYPLLACSEAYLVWHFMGVCFPAVVIPPIYFLFNIPYFLYYNLLFWSQNLYLGTLKGKAEQFSISNPDFVRAECPLNIPLNMQSMDEEILIISNYFWWKEPQKKSVQRALT